MIATDIDGTIIDWNLGDFTPNVKKCIKNLCASGVKVVLVTGRMHCACDHIVNELGLDTPVVSYQGGLIKDKDGNTLYQQNLNANYAKQIIKWARDNDIHINLYIDDKLYVEKDNDFVKNTQTASLYPTLYAHLTLLKSTMLTKFLQLTTMMQKKLQAG